MVAAVAPPAGIRVSASGPSPKLEQFLARILAGDWRAASTTLGPMRDWNQKGFIISRLAEAEGRPSWLNDWVDHDDSATAWTARGAHSLDWAWNVRGSGTADTVNPDAYDSFFQLLHAAENDLFEAARRDPADPLPWTFLIPTALGLGLHKLDVKERFDEVLRRNPADIKARRCYLATTCNKWGGSHEMMFGYARQHSAASPPGSPVHALVAEAWIERWLWDASFEEQPEEALSLMREAQPELQAAAERSVFNTAWQHKIDTRFALQEFAFCFWLGDDEPRALALLQRIGACIDELPWSFYGNPIDAFHRVWNDCLAEVRPTPES